MSHNLDALLEHLTDENLYRGKGHLPFSEWVTSPYMVGEEVSHSLYPYWRESLGDIFQNRDQTEILFGHATGSGKTTGAMVAWMRFVYDLSWLESPQKTFKLMKTSKIYLAYLGTTIKQAELTGFGDFRNLIDSVPYFQRDFPRDPDSKEVLKFPKNIHVISGSGAEHTIGTNLISVVMDETNFHKTGGGSPGDLEHVMALYANCRSRIRSRFMKKDIKFPGMSILVSSPTTQSSFTQRIIEENSADTRYFTGALWEVAPAGTYSSTGFYVFKGSERTAPFVVQKVEDIAVTGISVTGEDVDAAIKALPPLQKAQFVWVPEEFRRDFLRTPLRCLADLAGIPVGSYGRLMTSKAAYHKCVNPELRHPFIMPEITVSLMDSRQVMDFFQKEIFFTKGSPTRHPREQRYIHIDQSTANDSTGISVAHLAGYTQTPSGSMPLVEVDFMIRINPPAAPDKISIEKCRKFIFDLRDAGMAIGGVTMDTWGSVDFLQIIAAGGIPASVLSVDRDDGCYLKFVEYVLSGAVSYYDYPPFQRELFSLNHDRVKGKVDHPKKNDDGSVGGKDVTDSVVGAFMGVIRGNPYDESKIDRQNKVMSMLHALATSDSDVFDPAAALFPDIKGEYIGGEVRHIGDRRFMP